MTEQCNSMAAKPSVLPFVRGYQPRRKVQQRLQHTVHEQLFAQPDLWELIDRVSRDVPERMPRLPENLADLPVARPPAADLRGNSAATHGRECGRDLPGRAIPEGGGTRT